MFIVAGLRHKHTMGSSSGLDEMMRANVRHNFCSRINLSMQRLLQLLDRLNLSYFMSFDFQEQEACCTGKVPSHQDSDLSWRLALEQNSQGFGSSAIAASARPRDLQMHLEGWSDFILTCTHCSVSIAISNIAPLCLFVNCCATLP
jgi:hypothetical protein